MIDIERMIVAMLRANAGLVNLVGERIYATVADVATYPAITFSVISAVPQKNLNDDTTKYRCSIQISLHCEKVSERVKISHEVIKALYLTEKAQPVPTVLVHWGRLGDVYDIETTSSTHVFTRAIDFDFVIEDLT